MIASTPPAPLHVALVSANPVRIGGMQTFTRNLVRAILDAGGHVTVALSGEDIYSSQATAAGGRLRVERVNWVDSGLGGDRRYTWASVLGRRRWFREVRPDVALFVQSSNTPFRASVLAAWLAGVPIVTTHRTMPALIPHVPSRRHLFGLVPGLGIHRRLTVARTWITSLLAHSVVYNSSGVKRGYESDYAYPSRKGVVIPNALTIPPMSHAGDAAAPGRTVTIGYVGRLGREKALDVLFRAVARLGMDSPVRLLVYGEGPEREALGRLAEELNLGDRLEWWGPTQDVWSAYARMDIVALCSPRESSSNMVLEAMGAGKAVVVTRVGGLPELVGHGRWGVCVPPGDVSTLAGELQRLIDDPPLRSTMGRLAARAAREEHDPSTIHSAWLELLHRMAGRRRSTRLRALHDASAPLPTCSSLPAGYP